jgi:hypothetical protein
MMENMSTAQSNQAIGLGVEFRHLAATGGYLTSCFSRSRMPSMR